ncbi:NUDIX domain-containing protein [Nonomuraea sp. NN258]|uniref:NUDIX domain-containing protein n=1 Tax=Nonomuraea antri TaxID=2730852 RepID=UPI00156974B7|nr:NUDIX domain-containing protein [Nonomuraea antri]NRQ38008.1 NUDIX domain-containing protein [Nonomuraea antri]
MTVPGHDYIGLGVGAMVFDARGRVFMTRRGPAARNERGSWEFPGGMVAFGETLHDAVRREFVEEYGMRVEPYRLLDLFDHILPDEGQHWISATYLAAHVAGTPAIREPDKCTEIGWFELDGLPGPVSLISARNLERYLGEP